MEEQTKSRWMSVYSSAVGGAFIALGLLVPAIDTGLSIIKVFAMIFGVHLSILSHIR